MTERLEWGGWALEGKLVTKPKRIWLRVSEATILSALLKAKGKYVLPQDLHSVACRGGTLQTMRTKMATLRDAIGRKSIFTSRDYGYRLQRADDGHGNVRDPLDEMIENMTNALEAAKRLRHTRKQEKSNAAN